MRARVVVDAMGSFSPIASQSRGGSKPDSVVLMVGSCAVGLPKCTAADLLYSFSPLNKYVVYCPQDVELTELPDVMVFTLMSRPLYV